MKSTINIIKDHLQASTLASRTEIESILSENQNWTYSGPAYRVILQSIPMQIAPSVREDVCFSKTLSGVAHYLSVQDLDYYKFIAVYKVNVIRGLDVAVTISDLSEENLSDILSKLDKEEEVLVCSIGEEEIIYIGLADGFNF